MSTPSTNDRRQPELFDQESPKSHCVKWMIRQLTGRQDWTDSKQLCELAHLPYTRSNMTIWVECAKASEGRIIGHQKGYKLATEMTKAEFEWWDNETLKSIRSKAARLVASRRVFYGRPAKPETPIAA